MCRVVCIEQLLDGGQALVLLIHSLILGDLLVGLVRSAKNRHSVSISFWLPEKSEKIVL